MLKKTIKNIKQNLSENLNFKSKKFCDRIGFRIKMRTSWYVARSWSIGKFCCIAMFEDRIFFKVYITSISGTYEYGGSTIDAMYCDGCKINFYQSFISIENLVT